MTTIAILPKQLAVLTYALDAMREADSEDFDYTSEDLPVLTGEDHPGLLEFPTSNRGVVEDLVYRLEHNAPEDETRVADTLANTIRRAFGMYAPDKRPAGPTVEQLALLGAHPDLIRQGIFKGVDLKPLADRLWTLDAMRSEGSRPAVRWRALSRGAWVSGRAMTHGSRIVVSLGPMATIENAAEVLLHELVHMACPPKEHHGELFCRRLIACAREAFGLDLDTTALLALSGQGHRGKRAYAIDDVILKSMVAAGVGAKLREGAPLPAPSPETPPAVVPVVPSPVETEADAKARRGAQRALLIAAREDHARAKLAAWEKRLATAKKRAQKWRTTVRYYERRQEAAKRGGQ
jgi:hypothetical protein